MKAAVLSKVPGRLTVADLEIDRPRAREVLVRTAAAGVCHSELHFMDGSWTTPLPAVLGHEVAGVVEAVGTGVTYLRPGDHVVGCLTPFCGHCEYCMTGRPALCRSSDFARQPGEQPRIWCWDGPVHQFVNLSAFAERMLVHEHTLVRIDPEIPLDRAALVGCAVMTGVGAVANTAQVRLGDSVAVIGCDGIGLNCIQGAKLVGAARVVAVDVHDAKLELARRFGATHVVNAREEDAVDAVRRVTGDGVDHAFEAVGSAATVEQAWQMLRRGGTVTVVGLLPEGSRAQVLGTDFVDEKAIQGSNMGSNRFRVDMPRLLALYQLGRLEIDALISRRISLAELDQAYDDLRSGQVARSVVVFDEV